MIFSDNFKFLKLLQAKVLISIYILQNTSKTF